MLEIRPDTLTEENIADVLKVGKQFLHGVNRNGYPCLNHFPRLHKPNAFPIEKTLRLKYFWFLKALQKKES